MSINDPFPLHDMPMCQIHHQIKHNSEHVNRGNQSHVDTSEIIIILNSYCKRFKGHSLSQHNITKQMYGAMSL